MLPSRNVGIVWNQNSARNHASWGIGVFNDWFDADLDFDESATQYIGRITSGHGAVSVARMLSPGGWVEPGQKPAFEEITIVLKGSVLVEFDGGQYEVNAGQAVIARPGEWVRYSTPGAEGAEYIAVCVPAFSPETVNRDE